MRNVSKLYTLLAPGVEDHSWSEMILEKMLIPMRSMEGEEREQYAANLIQIVESSKSEEEILEKLPSIQINH